MVTHGAGLGDRGYNDLANAGGEMAAADFGITWQVIESRTPADYVPNVEAGAEQGALTIGVGFLMTEAIATVASERPESNFLLVDSVVDVPNVASLVFKEQEAAFLAGVVAGMMTQSGRLGMIGGQAVPPVQRAEMGFRAGVAAVAPDVEISVAYADSFEDPAIGREMALAQFGVGADILFAVAGKTGLGVFEAAGEQLAGRWVIGSDVSLLEPLPVSELAAVRKGIDSAVYITVADVVAGEFQPGVRALGLADEGVAFDPVAGRVPEDVLQAVEAYQDQIIAGELAVPATSEELALWRTQSTPIPVAARALSATPEP
jgi:basic membrane protein A